MGPEGAVNIIYRRDLAESPTPDERRAKLIDDYKARFANPYTAAERGYIDDVIVAARDAPEAHQRARDAADQARAGPEAQARQHPAVVRVVVAAALAVLVCAAPAGAVEVFADRGGTMIDGVAAFPENTLPAFRHAARAGTALEFNLRTTRTVRLARHPLAAERFDGRPHGAVGPTPTTRRPSRRHCRADWPGARKTTRVPTLRAVLGVASRNWTPVMVEIKSIDEARIVTETLRGARLPQRFVIVQSFIPQALRIAQHRWPGVPTALLSTNGGRGDWPCAAPCTASPTSPRAGR